MTILHTVDFNDCIHETWFNTFLYCLYFLQTDGLEAYSNLGLIFYKNTQKRCCLSYCIKRDAVFPTVSHDAYEVSFRDVLWSLGSCPVSLFLSSIKLKKKKSPKISGPM